MSAPRARLSAALIAALAIPMSPSRAAPAGEHDAPKTLRAATFEVAPAALGHGRFRLSARLHPASAPAIGDETRTLKLSATFAPKASAATCPSPGAIFSDGFESP